MPLQIQLPKPHAAQRRVIQEARRFNVVDCGRRWGKALAIDTPIPTPQGWKKNGSLKAGDVVFDEHGNQCNVLVAHLIQYDRPCFKVCFSDNTSVVADAEHLWYTESNIFRKANSRKPKSQRRSESHKHPGPITTVEILKTLTVCQRKDLNHTIPIAGALRCNEADLPIDPYVLGAWLGDGSSAGAYLYGIDKEIPKEIETRGEKCTKVTRKNSVTAYLMGSAGKPKQDSSTGRWLSNASLQTRLKALGVFNNKHIPVIYLRASIQQRLDLLKGLMDTDGTCAPNGYVTLGFKSKRLIQEALELIRSLGFRPRLREGDAKLYGRVVGKRYRIGWATTTPVFHLSRKLKRQNLKKDRSRATGLSRRYITAVEPVESVPVRCITVDSPSSLYLCGEGMIPTHNSQLGIDRIAPVVLRGRPTAWFAPTYKILSASWRELKIALEPAIKYKSEQDHRLELIGGGELDMWSVDTDIVTRGRKYARVVLDEAALIKNLKMNWETAIRPTLADLRGDAWFLSTPRGMNDFKTLYDYGQNPSRPEWNSWQMPTSDNPFIMPEEIEAARQDITEGAFSQEYLAQFVVWEGAVFRKILEAASAEERSGPDSAHLYVIGVDWGKSRDYTVFTVIDVTTKSMVYLERSNTVDYVIQRGRLKALNTLWKPFKIIAESNSMGVPIIEELQRAGLPVQPFYTGNISKALAIDALALAFEQGDVKILNEPVLLGELQAYQSQKTPTGLTKYGAPEGQHDDTVMSLALAWYGIAEHRRFPEFRADLHVVEATQ